MPAPRPRPVATLACVLLLVLVSRLAGALARSRGQGVDDDARESCVGGQIKRNTRLQDEEWSDMEEDEREAKVAKTGPHPRTILRERPHPAA